MHQIRISDGVVSIEMTQNELDKFSYQLVKTQERIRRLLIGQYYIDRRIKEDDIEDLLFELEDNSEYLDVLLKSHNEITQKIQTTMDLFASANKCLSPKQIDGYQKYCDEYEKSKQSVIELFNEIEQGYFIEKAKKVLYSNESDLMELYMSIVQISDKQFVAILQLQSMLALSEDTASLLNK